MQRAVQIIVMARNNPARIQSADLFDAYRKKFRRTVQDGRRFVGVEKITRKHVATEKEVMSGTVKTTMAQRVSRQMDHLQTAPKREQPLILQKLVNCARLITKYETPSRFKPPAPPRDSSVGISSRNVS